MLLECQSRIGLTTSADGGGRVKALEKPSLYFKALRGQMNDRGQQPYAPEDQKILYVLALKSLLISSASSANLSQSMLPYPLDCLRSLLYVPVSTVV